MTRLGNGILAAIVCLLLLLNWNRVSSHGGGTPRLTNEAVGPYRLFAWSSPEPLRAGEIHITFALIVTPDSGKTVDETTLFNDLDQVVTGAAIEVTFESTGENEGAPGSQSGRQDSKPVTLFARPSEINPLYYEIDTILPHSGIWETSIAVEGDLGSGNALFISDVAEARLVDWKIIGGISIAFFFLIYASRVRSMGASRRVASRKNGTD